MMEKKYQLVAWTRNIADKDNARVFMTPSLESEVEKSFIDDLAAVHREENRHTGPISCNLARKGIRACENMARFKILSGHYGEGIRYLCFAALYCIWEDDNWNYWDTDLGHYSCFCGELRHEFTRLCEEAIALAKKHGREDVLQEYKPRHILENYLEHTRESRDLKRHLKEMAAWKR